MPLSLSASILVFVFFLLIPIWSAYRVRQRWLFFRRRVFQASWLPQVSYSLVRRSPDGPLGRYRLFASLQAVQGRDSLWIEGNGVSLQVDLSNVEVYTLPRYNTEDRSLGAPGPLLSPPESEIPLNTLEDFFTGEIPPHQAVSRILSYSEGTRVFVCGSLFVEDGRAWFRGGAAAGTAETDGGPASGPVMLIFYDGPEDSIFLRAIWTGRSKNELTNPLSLLSLAVGPLLLTGLACLEVFQGRTFEEIGFLPGLILLPLLMFLPPGILFFEIYRHNWTRGRRLRADRDLLHLVLGIHPQKPPLQSGDQGLKGASPLLASFILPENSLEAYTLITGKARLRVILSWLCLLTGIAVNYFLFTAVVFYFLRA